MATEKRIMERVVSENGSTVQVLFETSADQVTLEDAGGNYAADNVEGALSELATKVASAGKVDDVVNANGTSIVENKVAQMKNAVVKEAGKVTKGLTLNWRGSSDNIRQTTYDGSMETTLAFSSGAFHANLVGDSSSKTFSVGLSETGVTPDTYNSVSVDVNGRVYNGTKEDYALKNYVDTQDGKKLDKAGGTVTGALAVNGGLTVGGNLTVNGTTTTVDSTTLQVKDKLIEVAHGNTTKLTTPAGLVAPKYDGTNSGALVFDGDGVASVGDVVLDASGNIDVTNSQLQTLATRTGLVNGNLVQYDGANLTLVDSGKKVSDFATAAQGATADAAKTKADTNATDIANIKNGTTVVQNANHANTADSAANVTTNINGKAITSIFETNGTTVKNATHATSADSATTAGTATTANKVAHRLKIEKVGVDEFDYDGSKNLNLRFDDSISTSMASVSYPENTMVYNVGVAYTGIDPGVYTAVSVDYTGRATAGYQIIEWGISGQTKPTSNLVVGGLFMKLKQ